MEVAAVYFCGEECEGDFCCQGCEAEYDRELNSEGEYEE